MAAIVPESRQENILGSDNMRIAALFTSDSDPIPPTCQGAGMSPISTPGRSGVFDWAEQRDAERRRDGLIRTPRARTADEPALDLASNDYLGLAHHPDVTRAAADAALRWGAGSTGSRLVTGTTELHRELETELAAWYGAESALVFSSGYAANLAAVTGLTGPGTLLVSDQHNHASLIDGCRLSRARSTITPHAETKAVDEALRSKVADALMITESVFSVDGDIAPLRELHEVCGTHGAALLIDDAHGLGVLGPGGSGALGAAGLVHQPDTVATVTLSKSMGAQGGAVLGPRRVIEHLAQTARTFIFDTGLAPASTGAALAALRLLWAEPDRADRVRRVADQLHGQLTETGLAVGEPGAAVMSIPAGSPTAATEWADACYSDNLMVGCFRPPSVPDTSSRLRLTVRADLTGEQIERSVKVLARTAPAHALADGSHDAAAANRLGDRQTGR